MRYIITLYFICFCLLFTATSLWSATAVQQQLQSARILLDQPSPDVAQLKNVSDELKAFVLSDSDIQFQDSTYRTIAQIARATSTNPLNHQWALELCTTDPNAPWIKYALPYVWPINGSAVDQLEVADDLLDMCNRHPEFPWANEFKATLFRAYAYEQFWLPTAFLGTELKRANYVFSAQDQLTLANAFLRSDREQEARDVLNSLCDLSAPKTPQALRASVELGLIEQVLNREIQAKQEFEQAWSIWQKQRKKTEFNDPLVANAAARARWELLQFEFSALEKTLNVSLEWNAKEASRWCNDLEKSTNELLTLAPSYESAVAILTGRLHRLEGNALLRLGMYSSRPEDLLMRDKLRVQALAAFNQAADVFVLTAQHDNQKLPELSPGHWSSKERDFQIEARQNAYDLYIHAANQLEGWASSLWQQTPLRSFGQNGYSPRFDAIVDEAFPVLQQCADYRKLAWRYARQNAGIEGVDPEISSLFQDFEKPVFELRKLCGSQWQSASANATQISRTLSVTSNPDAVVTMTENLAVQIDEAQKLADESQAALDKMFTQMFAALPDHESLAVLAEHKIALDREFAGMNRTIHESLDAATHNLDRRDPDAASLHSKLYKFSSRAADTEMKTLEAGHEWAEANGFQSEGGKELYARLSERDPANYPLGGGIWQAGR